MFYKSDIFKDMSGTSGAGLSPEDKQKYHFERIFNDNSSVFSIEKIISELGDIEEIEGANPTKKIELSEVGTTASIVTVPPKLPQLFQFAVNGRGTPITSSAFGSVKFIQSVETEGTTNAVDALLISGTPAEGSVSTIANGSLMLVKVENNEVHPAYHSTEASEVFLNYIPTIERSRCTPELTVNVFTRGVFDGIADDTGADLAGYIPTPGFNPQENKASFLESAPNLVALRFLNDYSTVGATQKDSEGKSLPSMPYNSADGLMTMASTTMHESTSTPQLDSEGEPARYQPPEGSAEGTEGGFKPNIVKPGYTMQKNGMEMFTMPQSLISKKKGVNIDPFRPFMSIKSVTINTQSAGQGLIAWNTAELVLEVYDRHRLNDIAFLLDPGKYGFTKFEISAGWRHQDPSSPYGKYLNRLKTKEVYALKSSSYSFNDSGVVTVNLSLAMSGQREMSNTSMFSSSPGGAGIRELHESLIQDLQTVRAGTTAINSRRTTGNLLPTSIATQADSDSAMILDNNALQRVKNARGQGNMSEEEQAEFNTALSSLTSSRFTEYYTMLDTYVGNFLEQCGLSGQKINLDFTRQGDPYTYRWSTEDKWLYKGPENDDFVLMTENIEAVEADFRSQIDEQRSTIASGNDITFDKLFINAIVKRLLLGDTPPADEIHVFIYQFNRKCPGLANQYIGNFRINNNTVREKLKKSIRETQNLTVATFTSVIRSEMKDKFNTQFSIVTGAQLTEIEGYRTQIDEERDKLRQKTATREEKTTRQSKATSEATRAALQTEITALDTAITALESKIADLQDKIDDLVEAGETSQQRTLSTSKVEMPDLKILVQSKRSQDGKNILRMHVYDGKSKPNELQTFLSNLNNGFSIDARDLNLRRGDTGEEVITNRDSRTALIEKLKEKGILISRDSIDEYGVPSQKYVVNTQSHKLKHTIKDSMPSITYGVDGTAINKISMNMLSDDNIQAHFLLQTQNENTPNTNNSQTPGSQEDAQKIMPANLSIDLMGCPLLRYGQEYFVDFDTNTDLDNVYAMTKITHKISPGDFKTTAQLKPTFKGSVSFTGLISDVRFLNSPTSEEAPASTTTNPTTAAAE